MKSLKDKISNNILWKKKQFIFSNICVILPETCSMESLGEKIITVLIYFVEVAVEVSKRYIHDTINVCISTSFTAEQLIARQLPGSGQCTMPVAPSDLIIYRKVYSVYQSSGKH